MTSCMADGPKAAVKAKAGKSLVQTSLRRSGSGADEKQLRKHRCRYAQTLRLALGQIKAGIAGKPMVY